MILSLLLTLSMQADELPRIVVTPLTAERNVDAGLVNLLGDLMLTELDGRGFRVLGYTDIQAMMDNEAAKAMTDCDGTSCLAELGDAMGARFLIHSSLGKIGAQYLLNVKLIDVEKATVKSRITRQVSGEDESVLIQTIKVAVAELMNEKPPPPPPPVAGEAGSFLPVSLGVSGVIIGVAGAVVGAAFGSAALAELKYSPADTRYPASLEAARAQADISTLAWIVAGTGAVVGAAGFGWMVME